MFNSNNNGNFKKVEEDDNASSVFVSNLIPAGDLDFFLLLNENVGEGEFSIYKLLYIIQIIYNINYYIINYYWMNLFTLNLKTIVSILIVLCF